MKKQPAFTLLELIVAIGLSFLVLLGLGAVFSGTLTVWTRIQQSGNALKEGRIAMRWITWDIKNSIKDPVTNNIITLAETAHIKINTPDGEVEYYLNGDIIYRSSNDDSDILLPKNVTHLEFNYYEYDVLLKQYIKAGIPGNIRFVSIDLKIKNNGKELELRNGAGVKNYEPS